MAAGGREPGKTAGEWTAVPSWEGYAAVRRSLVGVLRESREPGELPVPACPGWTVRDTIAHLVGICQGVEARLGQRAAARPGLAAVRLGELDVDALADEWGRSGRAAESALARPGHSHQGAVLVMDAFTHELDVRIALGAPFPVGHPAFRGAFEVVIGGLSGSVMALGLPALVVAAGGADWLVGDGDPAAVVRGSAADLYRSLTGRRTGRQIANLAWSADPRPWLRAFRWGPFRPPDQPAE
jgi:uncharacterized protein (TIGR03083 family)